MMVLDKGCYYCVTVYLLKTAPAGRVNSRHIIWTRLPKGQTISEDLLMNKYKWLNLQLFAGEGSGGDGGEGAGNTGESAVDPEQQRLLELGVPEDKIRRRAKKNAAKLPEGAIRTSSTAEPQQSNEQDAAADAPTEEAQDVPARMSWDEIMADPEYNKQMQAVVQSRLRSAKGAEDALGKLTPALELLARKHDLDPNKLDYEALAQAISDDESFYEDRAIEMGVSIETAKKIDQDERYNARQQREQQRTLEEQKFHDHFVNLERQGETMKTVFPNFDLRTELQNPAFARMTSPNVGISVEDAYYAVHRKEIQTAAIQGAVHATTQKISNAIQAGGRRPQENGTSGQAPSVTTFDYRKASREQRDELKRRIREASARGEKLYPGR